MAAGLLCAVGAALALGVDRRPAPAAAGGPGGRQPGVSRRARVPPAQYGARVTRAPLLLAAVLLLSACSGDDGPQVQTGEVTRATVAEVVDAAGAVTARATAAVTSPADGTVAAVVAKDGQLVKAGDVLLRLSSPSAQEALSQALAANAAGAAAGVAGQALAASQLQTARETVDALTVRAPIAGVVTLGAGAPAAAGSGLSGLLGALPPALQGAAGAALGGGGGGTPGSSTTTNDLSVGAPVGTGTPLLTVTDLSSLGVAAEVDETDVLLVTPGTKADVELDAVPGTTYPATVRSVELAPTTSTGGGGVGYRVRLTLDGGTPQPRPGMSAVVSLKVREAKGVLAVPSAALVRDDGADVVFVVDGDDRAERRVVRTGAEGADTVEVLEGLREGERLVVRDADRLSDGDELDL